MNDRLRTNALASGAQAVVTAAILFLTYRYLLGSLSAEQFGLWALVASIAALARVGDLGLSASLSRFVAVDLAAGDRESAASVVQSATVAVALFASGFALLVYWPARWLLPGVVPADFLAEARALLPFTLISLVLLMVGLTLAGALEGCQLFVRRAVVGVAGSLALLFGSMLLVPGRGVVGIGIAQVLQGIVVAALAWLLTRREFAIRRILPMRLQLADLRRIWSFGLGVQAISVTQLLVEPLAKVLMTRFGSLGETGLFELAYRITTQLRAPLVAGCQVVLPAVAALDGRDAVAVRSLHRRAFARLLPLALLGFGLLLVLWPAISLFLVGHFDRFLMIAGAALTVAWFVNTLSAPAYFVLLGRGSVRWNLLGHVVVALLTAVLCVAIGAAAGGYGVIAGYALAIVLGSLVVIAACRHRLRGEP